MKKSHQGERDYSPKYLRWKKKANVRCLDCGKLITPKSKSGFCHSCVEKGERSYHWMGDNLSKPDSGGARARKLYPAKICEITGSMKNVERHHIDGNPLNNNPENIMILTRYQHQIQDGRIEQLRNQASMAGKISVMLALRDERGKFINK